MSKSFIDRFVPQEFTISGCSTANAYYGLDFPDSFIGFSKAPNIICSGRYLQIQVE